ncbi:MAG: Hpt domain-containing protein [Nitrosomonadales bacterium]|nr:Hpt domain-containing protein [Nitrosomonadales bacterium]
MTNNSAQFDRNTLAAVKPGMDSTLAEIIAQMELFLAAPANGAAAIGTARTQMHSLKGVLKMVGLDGVAAFCEELDITLGELEANPQQASVLYRDAIRRALFGITHYLDALASGASNATLRLFPEYQELQQLRGMEMSFELDLFYPELDVQLPPQVLDVPAQSDAQTRLKALRGHYQQGLLRWMRQEDVHNSVLHMQQALDGAMRCTSQDNSRAFWWVGCGMLECLKQDGLPAETNVRKLLSRIDQQLRATAEGNPGDVRPVLNEMLYLVGRSQVASDLVDAIREVYALDGYLPQTSALPPGEIDQLLGVMRDQLRVAEESWELCAQGDKAACEKFVKYADQLVLQSEKLDRDILQYLARQIRELSQNVNEPAHVRPIAMDMAMALLLLGSGIENYNRLGSGFQAQARILSERMQAAVQQQPEDAKQLSELVDLNYEMEQRGDVMGPLANEMLVNLQHVEEGLNTFFGDALKRDGLIEILRLLSQIQGGLRISSLTHAAQLLSSVQDSVRHFSRTTDIPKPAERYALADALSALENYMQHLTHGQAGDVWRLQDALAEMLKLKEVPAVPAAAPAAQPQAAPASLAIQVEQVIAPVAAPPVAPPQTPVALEIAPEETKVPEIAATMEMAPVEPAQIPEAWAMPPAEQVPAVLEITPAEPAQAAPAEPAPPLEFAPVETPQVQAETRQLSDEERELLDIFLEEAQEVLATISSNLGICQSHPDSHESLVAIRRGFHTLKGSGRMVGLTDLGEVAWSVESAMNKWLQDKKPASPELLHLISAAVQSFIGWVEILGSQGIAHIEASDLMAAAKQIESGQEPDMAGVAAAKPVPEPGISAAPTPEPAPERAAEPSPVPELSFEPLSVEEPTLEPEEEETVAVGEVTLSMALFSIASTEARENTDILHQQLGVLRAAQPPVVQYDFMRAAHTLAGVSRTMGFDAVVELASALEGWLEARVEKTFTLNEGQLHLLEQSIAALDGMVRSICDRQMPQASNELAGQLHADRDKVGEVAAEPAAEAVSQPMLEITPEQPVPEQPPRAVSSEKGEQRAAEPTAAPAAFQPVVLTVVKPAEESAEAGKPQVVDELDDQLLPVFLEEADDLSPKISEGLRAWRENPRDDQQLQLLKRLLHTMKGSSRMVGAMRIGELAHEMEDRVQAAAQQRDEAGYWDVLEGDFDRITALLEELRGGKPVVEIKPVPARRATDQPAGVERRADRRAAEPGAMLRVRADVVDRLVNEAGEISVVRSRMETEMRVIKDGLLELTASVIRLRQQLREVEIQAESQMQARVSLVKDNSEQFDPLEFDRFTRLQELTRFMNESVHDVQTVQQSMLKHLDETAAAMLAQGRITRELQQGLMNVRMVSFNSITDRLYRIVRQTGKELNKRANLELLGTGVELDRSVLEKMIAPFEHLLRNSIVHGLEDEQRRAQSGKLPIGEIRLSVRQESNEVMFEFSDDGAGLNYAKLREKGIALGSLQPDEEASEEQLAQLIFTPGLSTASEVTEIAGRGVGMDVVRSEITALGGRIDVSSKGGQGTKFTIHLPLTLAVTQIFMVRSGDAVYAIPSIMVEQVRQVKTADMEALQRDRQVEWQGNTYPLHYLPHLLGQMDAVLEDQPRIPVLLLRSGAQRIALRVDELLGNHEAMVKNIGPQLSRMPGIVGATILGNGAVVLILNPTQYMQRIGTAGKPAKAVSAKPVSSAPLIMVVDDSLTVRKITTRMLTRAGYQVVTATDGVDALEKLADCTPEVMLLDIEMPRMDGFALARELRRDPKTHDLPIIMITSRTADKHREYAMQLGVNTYLGKPYQEDDLLQNIADFVAEHK